MRDYFTECDEWLTGIADLDAQHAGLANCIRAIENVYCGSESTQSGNSLSRKQQLSELLNNLYQAAKEHFICEESAMREAGYPGYAAHQREHIMLLAELKLVIRDHESSEKEVDAETSRGLKVWFVAHVKLSDCKFSNYVTAHRVDLT